MGGEATLKEFGVFASQGLAQGYKYGQFQMVRGYCIAG